MNKSNQSFLNNLVDALDLEWDQEEDEIHHRDQVLDDVGTAVSDEIAARRKGLNSSYPFDSNTDGSVLTLAADWSAGQVAYIFCLVLSHVSRSEVVPPDLRPPDQEITLARNKLFESCATLAAAGFCDGPSFRLGALRGGAGSLLAKLKEIWEHFGDGVVRETPLPGAPERANDGGIDVIAWKPVPDGRPGTVYLLGQAASGHDWEQKAISGEKIRRFHLDWFDPPPSSPPFPTTFIPFRSMADLNRIGVLHGQLMDRIRLPRFLAMALDLPTKGIGPVECLDVIDDLSEWVGRHQVRMQGITGA